MAESYKQDKETEYSIECSTEILTGNENIMEPDRKKKIQTQVRASGESSASAILLISAEVNLLCPLVYQTCSPEAPPRRFCSCLPRIHLLQTREHNNNLVANTNNITYIFCSST